MTYDDSRGRTDAARQGATQVAETAREEGRDIAAEATTQARDVAGTARDEAQHVADAAKSQAGEVVGQAKERAADVVEDLRAEVRHRADEQGARAAGALHDASRQLRSMARSGESSGMLVDLAGQAADRVDRFASRIDEGGIERVMHDVRSYAQRKPGTFLLAAGAAGFVLGRLARNASGATGTTGGAAPQPMATGTTPAPLSAPYGTPPSVGYDTAVGTEIPAGTEAPYLGGATPPAEVYGERPR
jgi:hypothetical protein